MERSNSIPTSMLPINCWYAVYESSKLLDSDQLVKVTIMGYDIVLKRQSDSSLVALYDRCPHMGLPLSKGRTERDSIICGFHGVAFNQQGLAENIPTDYDGAHSHVETVPSFRVQEKYGWVWVFIGNQPDQAAPIPEVEEYGSPGWTYSNNLAIFQAEQSLVVVNNGDLLHFVEAHRNTLIGAGQQTGKYAVKNIGAWTRSAEIEFRTAATTHLLKLVLGALEIKTIQVRITLTMPGIGRVHFKAGPYEMVLFASHLPVSPGLTISRYIVLRNFCAKGPLYVLAEVISRFFVHKVISQDQAIAAELTPSGLPAEVVLGRGLAGEQLIAAYLQMRADYYKRGWLVPPCHQETIKNPPII